MNTIVLLNRGGGSAGDRARVEAALCGAGINADPQWLDGAEIAAAAAGAVEAGASLVIAGGGDGTIGSVAGALAGSSAAMGVLPLGTLNHFARDLGIPADHDQAAAVIAAGHSRRVDLATVNGRPFVNNSAIGIYPLMVAHRELQQRRLGRRKRLAMAVAAVRTLLRFSSNRLVLTIDERTAPVETPLLFVGNNDYRLGVPGAGTRERLDQGELCVIVLRRKSRLGFCAATLRALLGRERRIDVVRVDGASRVVVDSRRSHLTVSIDGEVVRLAPPLEYRIHPKRLQVLVPAQTIAGTPAETAR